MEPPPLVKLVGRPRVKRTREKDEARKRQEMWSKSRKELLMTCGYCSTPGYNIKSCPLVKGKHKKFQGKEASQSVEDVNMISPTESQGFKSLFIPEYELNLSSILLSNQQSSRLEFDSACFESGPSFQLEFDPVFQFDDEEIEHESDPTLMPKVISEAKTTLKHRQLLQNPVSTRKISFMRNESYVILPTNLPYSPRTVTWKGKTAMTSNQLIEEKERRLGKMKATKGRL